MTLLIALTLFSFTSALLLIAALAVQKIILWLSFMLCAAGIAVCFIRLKKQLK